MKDNSASKHERGRARACERVRWLFPPSNRPLSAACPESSSTWRHTGRRRDLSGYGVRRRLGWSKLVRNFDSRALVFHVFASGSAALTFPVSRQPRSQLSMVVSDGSSHKLKEGSREQGEKRGEGSIVKWEEAKK